MASSEDKQVSLHPGQVLSYQSDARFIALIAGTGGGKTYFGPIWLYNEICKYSRDVWMVAAPTYKMLRRATIPMLVDFFEGTKLEGTLNRTDGEYRLPDGGVIHLCSADDPNHMEGGQFRGIWLDEAGQMTRWVWVVVRARLGLKQGRCLITTTPYAINWLYHEIFVKATVVWIDANGTATMTRGDDPNYYVVQFPSVTNPYYSIDEFEQMKGTLTEAEFNMRYQARFEQLAGLAFPDLYLCAVNHDRYKIKDDDMWAGGLDPGYTDQFGALTGVIGDDGNLHLRKEFYETNKLLKNVAPYLDPRATYYGDPHAKRELEELQELGVSVTGGMSDLRPGIMRVNEWAQEKKIIIPRDLFPNLLAEAAGCAYEDPEKLRGDTDRIKLSKATPHHLLDALRYLVWGVSETSGDFIYLMED